MPTGCPSVKANVDVFGLVSLLSGLAFVLFDCVVVSAVSIGCIAPKHGVKNINTVKRCKRFFMINLHLFC